MKYNIISINDDRITYKNRIREIVDAEEITVPAIDGSKVDLKEEIARRGLRLTADNLTRGEVGVWLSTYDNWKWAVDNNEPLLTFEDDAIPTDQFNYLFRAFRNELPEKWDFLSLWVPENQLIDYVYDVVYDENGFPDHVGPNRNALTSVYNCGLLRLVRVYQGYGNVAMYYSPRGAMLLMEQAREWGICGPIDCFIFAREHAGSLKGYAPKPNWAKAVGYDWLAETTVHNTELHL